MFDDHDDTHGGLEDGHGDELDDVELDDLDDLVDVEVG